MNVGKIYKLVNPISNEPFYIGQTTQSLETRLSFHLLRHSNKANKIIFDELASLGEIPRIELVEEVVTDTDSRYDFYMQFDARERYWIDAFIRSGHVLTNHFSGSMLYHDSLKSESIESKTR